jgi:hypothetical protein
MQILTAITAFVINVTKQPARTSKRIAPWLRVQALLMPSLALLLLAGCGTKSINLQASYPTPLVPKLPLTVGVYYTDEFRNFVYTEIDDSSGKDQYLIASGQSQLNLFNTILPALFEQVVMLDTPDTSNEAVDAVFIPNISEFQLGLPQKTRLSVYEIWLKYNMRLTQPNGDYIADWVMTAYGKTPTANLMSVDKGVQGAAEVAMRDLAATFTLGFSEIPDVRDWLQQLGRAQ